MKIKLKYLLLFILVLSIKHSLSQTVVDSSNIYSISTLNNGDSSKQKIIAAQTTNTIKEVIKPIKKHDPKIATKRSLILPGWGQAYNKQYWKIPLVWGALSIPTITFLYNNNVYKESKFAYEAKYKAQYALVASDSADYNSLDPKYQKADINAIQTLRNAARRDRDYSIFWFIVIWGLNVADATVFGHLKEFDVSNDLSMKIKPDFNLATKTPALNFNFSFKNKTKKLAFSSR